MQYERLRYRSWAYLHPSENPPRENSLPFFPVEETMAQMTDKEVELELYRHKAALDANR